MFAQMGGRRSAELLRAVVATSVAWVRAKTEWGEAAGGGSGAGSDLKRPDAGRGAPTTHDVGAGGDCG